MKEDRYPSCSPRITARRRGGFTLVELLVAIFIIAVLSGLGFSCCKGFMRKGAMMREIAAGKTLILAYHAYAADNNGQLLPGMDFSVNSVLKPDGTKVTGHTSNRYPFRIAPYLDWSFDGSIFVNKNHEQIKKGYAWMMDYAVSLFPAFGINYYYAGGLVSKGPDGEPVVSFPEDCVTLLTQADASILVFASAGMWESSESGTDGYCILTPPYLIGSNWKNVEWTPKVNPGFYGNIDARHNEKAVCAFLDGSVRMHTVEELRDMRLWSRNASLQDNPEYAITQIN